jgi:hypothetical protein
LQREQHFFCIAAKKFVEFRNFVSTFGLLDQRLFAEIDKFKADITAVRDFNEHDSEYFRGKGKKAGARPDRNAGNSDWRPVRLGKIAGAMVRLLNSLPEFWSLILPHMPKR